MSEAITVDPRHIWILGLVADEAENQHGPNDLDPRDENAGWRASDANPVADEPRDER